jgi:hypothetical protein
MDDDEKLVLTMFELQILLDTTIGSLSMVENRAASMMFKYSAEQRRQVANSILERMNNVPVPVTSR